MKFLFLFLAILLVMEPVVSEEECWMKGKCRLVCKNDEDSVTRCSNRKRCCILSRYLTIVPMTIDQILPWTTPQVKQEGDS
ncbi:beta-defensin 119 isoform X2 [Bubalus kerabau]|uniref:Beta-defensin 120 n=1 Tax=Bubalus bubalis TaxID=89462 RepID=A0A1W6S9X4_BUBBU|nr:beta-defensin 121 isoform X2 [Bubalus bubalis]XP_055399183.1 beta-defensin 119 isoform X2 [Bubalus carabanensis]ARO77466.1 beta-defensin 120 [Bubalus bubalis]